jgi:hypothetical protein
VENTHRALEQPSHHLLARRLGLALAGLLALYLVGRGVAEFFTIDYSDPARYASSWGGPSLAGVLAVHTGPALVIVAASVMYLIRRRRRLQTTA